MSDVDAILDQLADVCGGDRAALDAELREVLEDKNNALQLARLNLLDAVTLEDGLDPCEADVALSAIACALGEDDSNEVNAFAHASKMADAYRALVRRGKGEA